MSIVHSSQKTLQHLNLLLYEELFAAETARDAGTRVRDARAKQTLSACADSHSNRAALLSSEIARRGGPVLWRHGKEFPEPLGRAAGSSAWIVATIADGEERRRSDYEASLDELDPQTRKLVRIHLLDEQIRTCELLSTLKRSAA